MTGFVGVPIISGSLLAGLLLFASNALSASQISEAGMKIAAEKCGSCHAIAASGDSPHADAPPFRTLASRYPLSYLEEALAEGIVTGHPDMPEVMLAPEAIAALLDYLGSIQQ